jgi:hypothetical protein
LLAKRQNLERNIGAIAEEDAESTKECEDE